MEEGKKLVQISAVCALELRAALNATNLRSTHVNRRAFNWTRPAGPPKARRSNFSDSDSTLDGRQVASPMINMLSLATLDTASCEVCFS